MADVRIRRGEWLVVADGGKALILENIGDALYPNLRTKEVFEHNGSRTNEIGTDRPGRSFSSVGPGRSAMEQTDWHAQEEERFLCRLAARLDKAVLAGEVKDLILVAPPAALGTLRKAISPHVREAIRTEIEKDYVKMPLDQIEKHLAA
ncbi:host attachment protein [Leptospira sp. severe_002]|uniref:host attachment protein n=1 Tax=Leptospira sp. severe_002 TaxID=2838237 RepID=UPI001E29B207|nr:host attachment family protein [Leptospira sp. severe_002]